MSKHWLSRSATLTCGGLTRGVLHTRQSWLERTSVKWVRVQIQQVWVLMNQQMNKSRAQWVIDHTWISLLPVNSFWVIDKPGLWTGPAALCTHALLDKRCVFLCVGGLWLSGCAHSRACRCAYSSAIRVCLRVCHLVCSQSQNDRCVCVCVHRFTWVYCI